MLGEPENRFSPFGLMRQKTADAGWGVRDDVRITT